MLRLKGVGLSLILYIYALSVYGQSDTIVPSSNKCCTIYAGQSAYFFKEKAFDISDHYSNFIATMNGRFELSISADEFLGIDVKRLKSSYVPEKVGDADARRLTLVSLNYMRDVAINNKLTFTYWAGPAFARQYESKFLGIIKHIGGPSGCWEEIVVRTEYTSSFGLSSGLGVKWMALRNIVIFPRVEVQYPVNNAAIPSIGVFIGYRF